MLFFLFNNLAGSHHVICGSECLEFWKVFLVFFSTRLVIIFQELINKFDKSDIFLLAFVVLV
jgi:hypothetical protein